jgi:oligoendopeptidase F
MADQEKKTDLPYWRLENIYPAIESPEFSQAFEGLESDINTLMQYMDEHNIAKHDQGMGSPEDAAKTLRALMEQMETVWRLDATLGAYLYGFISTDSFNTQAMKKNSELEILSVRINEISIRFKGWMNSSFKDVDELTKVLEHDAYLNDHSYYLRETLEQAKFLMSPDEETLAAELALSGSNAWGKLQGTVTS